MKIVLVNKNYYLKSGVERYFFELKSLLENFGHEVIPFSMQDDQNLFSEYQKYFVSHMETQNFSTLRSMLKTASRFIYSFEARRKFKSLLEATTPDLIHLHNIYHQLSPSILLAAKDQHLPVVMTAHDYKFIAPNYGLFHDGKICEHTRPNKYFRAVRYRCIKNSFILGLIEWLEMNFNQIFKLWNVVGKIITPSKSVARIFEDYGVDKNRLEFIPHFIDAVKYKPEFVPGAYVLFVGRLSQEKGVTVLIRAAVELPQIKFRVVGIGEDQEYLMALALELGAGNVEFVGKKFEAELGDEFRGARVVVAPSLSYETFGLTALEAMAHGKPVIASNLGGLAELVEAGVSGLLFPPGDYQALASLIARLFNDSSLAELLGRRGREIAETKYTPEEHYKKIFELYLSLLDRNRNNSGTN